MHLFLSDVFINIMSYCPNQSTHKLDVGVTSFWYLGKTGQWRVVSFQGKLSEMLFWILHTFPSSGSSIYLKEMES
jgi:hypothetical protein